MGNPNERNPQGDHQKPGQQQPGRSTHPPDKDNPKPTPGKDKGGGSGRGKTDTRQDQDE